MSVLPLSTNRNEDDVGLSLVNDFRKYVHGDLDQLRAVQCLIHVGTIFVGIPWMLDILNKLEVGQLLPKYLRSDIPNEIPNDAGGRNTNQEEWDVNRGREIYSRLYGEQRGKKLLRRYDALYPGLDSMILYNYDKFYSGGDAVHASSELTWKERELCSVAALGHGRLPAIMVRHIRGSLAAGASRDELRCVLDQSGLLFGVDAKDRVDATWQTFERSRYDL